MSKPTFLGPLVGKGAGQYELVNAERGAVLATHVEPAFDSKTRRRGLLGRDSVKEDYALIIAPCSAVHTFFMRFPIDAVFVSRDGTVVKTCRAVKPWRIAGALRAFAVIEAAPGFIDRTETVPGDVMALCEIPQKRRVTDALPPLAASSAHDAGVPGARRPDPLKRVTLADIIARKTPLGWFESVAIVQELCMVVLARGPADDPLVPELKHIALGPDGCVELLADGPAGHSPVHRAGLVLLALTPEAQLPLQLRLLALEEVSPTPRFKSLKDLHTELEFFERPDRLDIVRGVYERFQHLPTSASADAVIPPPLLEPPPPRRHHRWWTGKRAWAGIGILLLALAAAATVWAWERPEGEWLRSGVARVSRTATRATREAVRVARDRIRVVARKLGLASAATTAPSPVVAGPSPAAGAPLRPEHVAPTEPRQEAQTLPIALLGQPQPAEPPPPTGAVAPVPATGTPREISSPSQPLDPPATATVYTAADPLVVPPELIRPVLPKGPPPGVRAEDLPEVEILILSSGEVQTVRLLSSWPGPRAAMMLSAVKSWIFQPATRGGHPVSYRHRMRLPSR